MGRESLHVAKWYTPSGPRSTCISTYINHAHNLTTCSVDAGASLGASLRELAAM